MYGSIHIFGKHPWVNFLAFSEGVKSEKNTQFWGFGFLTYTYDWYILQKKMSQNGQFCTRQGQKQFTPGYMGLPLPTQMIHTEIQIWITRIIELGN